MDRRRTIGGFVLMATVIACSLTLSIVCVVKHNNLAILWFIITAIWVFILTLDIIDRINEDYEDYEDDFVFYLTEDETQEMLEGKERGCNVCKKECNRLFHNSETVVLKNKNGEPIACICVPQESPCKSILIDE